MARTAAKAAREPLKLGYQSIYIKLHLETIERSALLSKNLLGDIKGYLPIAKKESKEFLTLSR